MLIRLHKLILASTMCCGCVFGQNTVKQSWPDRVYGDTIYIFPREVLYFKAIVKDNIITSIKEIKPTEDSTDCLIISLDEKNTENLEDVPSQLTVYNPYSTKLHYKAAVKYKKKDPISFTLERCLPVKPKSHFFAIWAKQAGVVKVYNLRLESNATK